MGDGRDGLSCGPPPGHSVRRARAGRTTRESQGGKFCTFNINSWYNVFVRVRVCAYQPTLFYYLIHFVCIDVGDDVDDDDIDNGE